MTGAALEQPRLGALRRRLRPLEAAVLIAAASGVVAYTLVEAKPALALGLVLLPLVAWESSRLTAALVLLGASLPAFYNIAGGSLSVNIAVSDVLLAFIGAAILMRIVVTRSAPALAALRPIALPVVQYSVVIGLLLLAHLGSGAAQTGQRFELFLLPLVVGAYAALRGSTSACSRRTSSPRPCSPWSGPSRLGGAEEPRRPDDRQRDPAARRFPPAAPLRPCCSSSCPACS